MPEHISSTGQRPKLLLPHTEVSRSQLLEAFEIITDMLHQFSLGRHSSRDVEQMSREKREELIRHLNGT